MTAIIHFSLKILGGVMVLAIVREMVKVDIGEEITKYCKTSCLYSK